MEHYDVIIIGAGIAGCGLAYNLKRIGYEGKVLVIDGKEVGANAAYGYRIIFEDTLKKYNFKFHHKYKGIKIGVNDKVCMTIKGNYYLCDYHKICNQLLNNSNVNFKNELAVNFTNNKLKTNKSIYKFKYLIDASGTKYFMKKKLKQELPIRFWLGDVKVLNNKDKITDDYLYYMFDESEYMEDFYPLKDKILQGDWQYTKTIDFERIRPPKKTLLNNINNPKILKQHFVIDPVAPALPVTYQNYAFLGDSFGNGTPSAGVGIDPALESSIMLSKALKHNNLREYKKQWKKKYLKSYCLSLASRMDRYHNSKIMKRIKNYPKNTRVLKALNKNPELFIKLCKNEFDFKFPKEIQRMYPQRRKIFLATYYIYLRLKYLFK